jgi:tetratricopeptide (TPR) repeat protein
LRSKEKGRNDSVWDDEDVASDKSLGALFKEARALRAAARWDDAARLYDELLARLDDDSERGRRVELILMYLKASCLYEQRDAHGTLATCDALLASYGARDERALGFIADSLWLKSRALNLLGEHEQELLVLRHLIEQYCDEPQAGTSVARAMYNLGIHLRDAGRGKEAVEMWDELFLRFRSSELDESFAFTPIRGQLAKSHYLAQTNRLDAALLTCERMLEECQRRGLPETRIREVKQVAHQCIVKAQASKTWHGRLRSLVKRT